MILTSLYNYYKRLESKGEVPDLRYSKEKISFVIVLSSTGKLLRIEDFRSEVKLKKGSKLLPELENVPAVVLRTGTNNFKPNFLWDNTAYVLGVTNKEDENEKTIKKHQSFKDLHLKLLNDIKEQKLIVLKTFIESWSPDDFDSLCSQCGYDPKEVRDKNIVFRLENQNKFIHEDVAEELLINLKRTRKSQKMSKGVCLVTGRYGNIPKTHPKIKGVLGGQSSGTSLVSFNEKAYLSYGKEQNLNAPVSEEASVAYTSVLNHLLRNNRQKIIIGDTTIVFWAEPEGENKNEKAERVFRDFLNCPSTEGQETTVVREILQQISKGRPMKEISPDLDENTKFYVLGLAPNAARLSIRFWEVNTFQIFIKRFSNHFRNLELDPLPWDTPPSTYRLVHATIPYVNKEQKDKNIISNLAGELLRSILTGRNYPASLLANVLMRFRNDGYITGIRVALCKAILMKNYEEEISMGLDENCRDVAYLLGRLFAELENAQRVALGDTNATIKDRYYARASSNPALVFPTLIRGCSHHLSKAKKDKGKKGAGINIDKTIGKIVSGLGVEYPPHLSLIDQGKFSIGYYHQANDFRNKEKGEQHESN